MATIRVRGTMTSFTTRSANSRTLLRSSSFTSSSTPSRVPISMMYSISALVTAGPGATLPPPKRRMSPWVARTRPIETGHRVQDRALTNGISAMVI